MKNLVYLMMAVVLVGCFIWILLPAQATADQSDSLIRYPKVGDTFTQWRTQSGSMSATANSNSLLYLSGSESGVVRKIWWTSELSSMVASGSTVSESWSSLRNWSLRVYTGSPNASLTSPGTPDVDLSLASLFGAYFREWSEVPSEGEYYEAEYHEIQVSKEGGKESIGFSLNIPIPFEEGVLIRIGKSGTNSWIPYDLENGGTASYWTIYETGSLPADRSYSDFKLKSGIQCHYVGSGTPINENAIFINEPTGGGQAALLFFSAYNDSSFFLEANWTFETDYHNPGTNSWQTAGAEDLFGSREVLLFSSGTYHGRLFGAMHVYNDQPYEYEAYKYFTDDSLWWDNGCKAYLPPFVYKGDSFTEGHITCLYYQGEILPANDTMSFQSDNLIRYPKIGNTKTQWRDQFATNVPTNAATNSLLYLGEGESGVVRKIWWATALNSMKVSTGTASWENLDNWRLRVYTDHGDIADTGSPEYTPDIDLPLASLFGAYFRDFPDPLPDDDLNDAEYCEAEFHEYLLFDHEYGKGVAFSLNLPIPYSNGILIQIGKYDAETDTWEPCEREFWDTERELKGQPLAFHFTIYESGNLPVDWDYSGYRLKTGEFHEYEEEPSQSVFIDESQGGGQAALLFFSAGGNSLAFCENDWIFRTDLANDDPHAHTNLWIEEGENLFHDRSSFYFGKGTFFDRCYGAMYVDNDDSDGNKGVEAYRYFTHDTINWSNGCQAYFEFERDTLLAIQFAEGHIVCLYYQQPSPAPDCQEGSYQSDSLIRFPYLGDSKAVIVAKNSNKNNIPRECMFHLGEGKSGIIRRINFGTLLNLMEPDKTGTEVWANLKDWSIRIYTDRGSAIDLKYPPNDPDVELPLASLLGSYYREFPDKYSDGDFVGSEDYEPDFHQAFIFKYLGEEIMVFSLNLPIPFENGISIQIGRYDSETSKWEPYAYREIFGTAYMYQLEDVNTPGRYRSVVAYENGDLPSNWEYSNYRLKSGNFRSDLDTEYLESGSAVFVNEPEGAGQMAMLLFSAMNQSGDSGYLDEHWTFGVDPDDPNTNFWQTTGSSDLFSIRESAPFHSGTYHGRFFGTLNVESGSVEFEAYKYFTNDSLWWTDGCKAYLPYDSNHPFTEAYITALYYQEQPPKIYVNHSASGDNNGSSWADAYTNLQDALNVASSGDVIFVAAGTHHPATPTDNPGTPQRQTPFEMKDGVKVYGGFPSSGSPTWADRDPDTYLTTLSGDIDTDGDDDSYHVVVAQPMSAMSSSTVLDGFTIRDGNADGSNPHDFGGGMAIGAIYADCFPVISNCTFTDNFAYTGGGGMTNFASEGMTCQPTVINCEFYGNEGGHGGGMANMSVGNEALCTPIIDSCIFGSIGNGNIANIGGGGGVFNWELSGTTSPVFIGCDFVGNSAANYGGGISDKTASPQIKDCTFSGNEAISGGAVNLYYSHDSEITNCIFYDNEASDRGGAIYNVAWPTEITNCTFYGNTADSDATNGGEGGALYCSDGSSPIITNCILWNNDAYGNTYDQIYPDDLNDDGMNPDIVTYCDIERGYIEDGNTIINDDPLFEDAVNGDFHLTLESPCIDKGTNSASSLPDWDFDGNKRKMDGDGINTDSSEDGNTREVDIGADEVSVIYVNINRDIFFDEPWGSSWNAAHYYLQNALYTATHYDKIWVASGPYTPTIPNNSPSDFDRKISFALLDGVEIYGGFPDTDTPTWEDRDPDTYLTILSGDIDTDASDDDYSYHVIYAGPGVSSSAVLDGFTIKNGKADDTNTQDIYCYGGGMLNLAYDGDCSPTVANCVFEENEAYLCGGGMMNLASGGTCNPTIINCEFYNNIAAESGYGLGGGGMANIAIGATDECSPIIDNCIFGADGKENWGNYGGGMLCDVVDSGGECSPELTNCIFSHNEADYGGGGIKVWDSSPILTNCIFFANEANEGAGMDIYKSSGMVMTNCLLYNNSADVCGGGINNLNSSPTVTNCTFSGNVAGDYGGAMRNSGTTGSSSMITNCILWGDTAGYSGNEISNQPSSNPTVTYCCIQGSPVYSGTGNINGTPMFENPGTPAGDDGIWFTDDDGLKLGSNSPCIDSGTNSAANLPDYDFEGDNRIINLIVDMGVDEDED